MSDLSFRYAGESDLPVIVEILADDSISGHREEHKADIPQEYVRAFAAMSEMPNNRILLAEQDGAILGVLQLTIIPGLTRRGATRGQIEGVRVRSSDRGHGVGSALVAHAIEEARKAGCALVQLTSDKRRPRAHLFYRRLGFHQSHEGFKLEL